MQDLTNYSEKKLTIDLAKATANSLKIVIPIVLLFGIPYVLLHTEQFTIANFKSTLSYLGKKYSFFLGLIPLVVMLIGIVLHELIHGLTFLPFCKNGVKSIKFGILKQYMTPYCHCKEPLKVKHYRVGVLMPAIVLGFIPAIVSIVIGDFYLLLFGMFFTQAAVGDFMILDILKNENKEDYVLDHPSEAGCMLYSPIQS
ncbi:DUF3267 domain-containing protein [Sphingobacterium hungaricum]|uniref:DUF3267 domain-containing protein n=1 Tax=Sphingobacterium hungaricum TaxID=2082723 RepID=A0A928V157_9SPHI|nr:DUF3267 domain-containing protein [Sphingobacterium hungaricum]MBE8714244.1 DUF3267 domain-containing protein [Sphingobacterium hungaricum]